jgi:hypothetical protein
VKNVNFNVLMDLGAAGARERFERLIAQLVILRYPNATQIEARPGDWGLDVIDGELDELVRVWQAKFFFPNFETKHRREVEESFDSVVAAAEKHGFTVDAWTLCIPTNFDPKQKRWWDGWKREQEKSRKISIDVWHATSLESMLLAVDADDVYRAYFERGISASIPAERPLEELEDPEAFNDSLFIAQLIEHQIARTDAAKRQYYNADILAREVSDKGVDHELAELRRLRENLYAMWDTRFNGACAIATDDRLPGLHGAVMTSIEGAHDAVLRTSLPAGLVHKLGVMHQIVDEGRAGWVRYFEEVARRYGR